MWPNVFPHSLHSCGRSFPACDLRTWTSRPWTVLNIFLHCVQENFLSTVACFVGCLSLSVCCSCFSCISFCLCVSLVINCCVVATITSALNFSFPKSLCSTLVGTSRCRMESRCKEYLGFNRNGRYGKCQFTHAENEYSQKLKTYF